MNNALSDVLSEKYGDKLVGHRGLMLSHPENTLSALKAAIDRGARFIECDLQLTKDQQPVVLHDATLTRTAAVDSHIFDLTLAEAQAISVHYPEKFGDKYHPEPIPSLNQFLTLLAEHPTVTAMIEIKQESIDHFNLETFINGVFAQISAYQSQVIVISFNADAVGAAKQAGFRSGWVVREMNQSSEQLAKQLLPDYLITNILKVDFKSPALLTQLWRAPEGHNWQWMLYDVTDVSLIKSLLGRGVDLIESGDFPLISC